MPLLLELSDANTSLIVYQMKEEDSFYLSGIDFTPFDHQEFNSIVNPLKRRQWLASRYWVKKLSKQHNQLYLEKSELGKPHFTNSHLKFSISHSKDCVAVICSETKEVAIDIEVMQDKILKIKSKFLHPLDYEQGSDVEEITKIWSAKETIYKYYHSASLYSFKEQIAILNSSANSLPYSISNFPNQSNHEVFYKKIEDLILTWIIEN